MSRSNLVCRPGRVITDPAQYRGGVQRAINTLTMLINNIQTKVHTYIIISSTSFSANVLSGGVTLSDTEVVPEVGMVK